jgi:hypothetical protein
MSQFVTNTDRVGDDSILTMLVAGSHPMCVAHANGVSTRTVYRRLRDPGFRQELESAKEQMRSQVFAKLSDAAIDAVSTLIDLSETSEDPNVRLKACKTIIDSLVAVHATLPKTKIVSTVHEEVSE